MGFQGLRVHSMLTVQPDSVFQFTRWWLERHEGRKNEEIVDYFSEALRELLGAYGKVGSVSARRPREATEWNCEDQVLVSVETPRCQVPEPRDIYHEELHTGNETTQERWILQAESGKVSEPFDTRCELQNLCLHWWVLVLLWPSIPWLCPQSSLLV